MNSKKIFFIVVLSFVTFLSCQEPSTEEKYERIAVDVCDCFYDMSQRVSKEFKVLVLNGAEEGMGIDSVMKIHWQLNPKLAEKDAKILRNLNSPNSKEMKCLKGLIDQFETIDTSEYSSGGTDKILELVNQLDDCEIVWAMFSSGRTQSQK
jgi:hypothetical protein